MLLRMYVRWGENQRFKTKVVEKSMGEEDGTKSATIDVEGRYVYGYISGEKGTHHIVQQYSFSSFSGAEVMSLLPEDSLNVEISEEDLEYIYYRAGGKGGQNVNKIESAVQITHIPTGVTVCCTGSLCICSVGICNPVFDNCRTSPNSKAVISQLLFKEHLLLPATAFHAAGERSLNAVTSI
ncbi:Peptide chain release factor PrfB1, chloroplastic [Orobanche minor]